MLSNWVSWLQIYCSLDYKCIFIENLEINQYSLQKQRIWSFSTDVLQWHSLVGLTEAGEGRSRVTVATWCEFAVHTFRRVRFSPVRQEQILPAGAIALGATHFPVAFCSCQSAYLWTLKSKYFWVSPLTSTLRNVSGLSSAHVCICMCSNTA